MTDSYATARYLSPIGPRLLLETARYQSYSTAAIFGSLILLLSYQ